MYKLKVTQEFGRGLYSTRKIYAGEIVMVCELLVLSEIDTPLVNATDLKWYTFKFNETQDCLVLGLGEIFNHTEAANVSYKLSNERGRPVMVFMSQTDIKAGQQLFIDYGADTRVNIGGYTVNLTGLK